MKKLISVALAGTLALSLAACGSSASSSAAESTAPAESEAASTSEAASEEATSDLAGTTLKVAASPTPHAEILNAVKDILAEQGITLEVVEFSDYVQPNLVTESGEVDANYFQHGPYLESFNEENGTHLVSVGAIHYEPFGIYPGKSSDLENIADGAVIAVPNDTTNESRALLLLQDLGYITLDENAGITATIKDITDNPYNIEFSEVEAAQLPNVLQDVDYAIINSNYAIAADINPVKDSLAIEGSSSAYGNILAVKEGNENSDKIKALKAALESKQVADFIADTYGGSVVSVVENPGDGFDSSVDYAALSGQTITVAASPAPHAEILKVAKDILAEKNITLDIIEYTDYVQPNNVVESGEVDANYFQHVPYLDDFNAENGTHIVSVSTVHVEPMGLYGGQQTSLDALKK